ncbi:MAG: hypothetical protein CBB69_008440 [Phycisphaera sp. TMED9]|nr:MAG: hypothetical protein CBB69_008440 [Phycisphaera sp. TMED9]
MNHDQNEQQIPMDQVAGESASSDASEAPRSASGDVLSLIEDVERHLTRIRDVQSRQETEFEDLAERQRKVDLAEKEFDGRRREVEEAATALDAARESMSTERSEIDGLRSDLEGRESRFSEECATFERSKQEFETAGAEMATERAALESRDAEIAERERTITEERQALDALRDEIEARENAFADRSAAADAALASVGELEAEVGRLSESVETQAAAHREAMSTAEETTGRHRTALESVGADLESAQAELEAARNAHESSCSELDSLRSRTAAAEDEKSQLQQAMSSLEERCTELDEAAGRSVELESELEEANEKVTALESTIEEDQRQLELAGEKLTELAKAISEQAPRLERGTAAIALMSQHQETIAKLEARLAEDGTDAANAVAKVRDTFEARIAELESALAHASAQGADPAALEAALTAARGPLEARIHELESGGGLDASAVEAAVEEATTPLLAEIERLHQDAESNDGPSVPRDRYDSVKERCRRAERRSDELETALSMTNDKGQAQEMAKRLRAKAERVGEAARHLELRKNRLLAVRKAIRARGGDAGSTPAFQELQRLEAQRKELSQVREFLSRSEQQMIRRWARPRSAAIVGWVMILAVLCSVGSWFGVQEMVPIAGAASVEIRATPRDGKPLSGSKAESWAEWHEALATDPAFVQVVSKRLAARGIAPSGGEPAVATMLVDDLSFESDGPGRLRLVLSGMDRRLLAPTLDAVATTMASESARQAPRRDDGARASLSGEQTANPDGGYATLIDGAISPDVLTFTGLIAGGALVMSLLMIGLVYLALARAKRVFEESESGGGEFAT